MTTNTIETMRGSELVGQALVDQGVQDLFFMMGFGGPNSPGVRACIDRGIQAYYIRHEAPAAMAAHAYARITKRPGVCITPLGPGTTNALTGLVDANVDSTPVLLIGSGIARQHTFLESFQEQDQMSMFEAACKATYRVEAAERIPEILAIALRTANSGRKGAVYVEIPGDLLQEEVDVSKIYWPAPVVAPPRAAAPQAELDATVKLLREAKRPLILSGSGVPWADAAAELQEFVAETGIPLVTTPQTRGVVPEDVPLALTASRNRAQREADVVFVLGTRANWINGHLRTPRFHADAKFVVANIDPEEIGRGRDPEVGIVADAKVLLQQLTAAMKGQPLNGEATTWAEALIENDRVREPDRVTLSDEIPINPLRLCEELRRVLPPDAVFIIDGYETLEFARRWIPSLSEGNYLTTGPNATCGVGVPFAIGAKVAAPDRPVFCLMGDGGFGWHGMEYDTLIRHGLPMVGIVFNNGGFTGRPAAEGTGRELGFQRYDLMVEGFGGHGEFVERPEDIGPALQRAIDSGKPALVNVCVDPEAQAGGGLLGGAVGAPIDVVYEDRV